MSDPERISPRALLAHRPFRLLWANSFLFLLVQSTQRFALVWLVLGLGARSDTSGVILFVMGVPALLLSMPVGLLSDRLDRRMILLVSQFGAVGASTVTAALVTTGVMNVGWAVACSFASGVFIAVGTPVRSAAVPTLVPRDQLVGAVAVNTIGNNIAFIVGPAAAGPIIGIWGISGAFWLQAALHAAGLVTLFPLRLPRPGGAAPKSLRTEIMGGVHFVRSDRAVRSFFVLLACSVMFMMSPWIVLGPQIAKEDAGATGGQTTMLFAVMGIGQLLTSLGILRWNGLIRRKGLWFMCGLCWGSTVQMLLGQSSSLATMGILLFCWGLGGGLFLNLNQTLIQNNTPPAVMGRVMAIQSFLMSGLAPAGALAVGVIARAAGSPPLVLSAGGAAMLLATLYFLAFHRHLRPLT